jgi:hemerythrin superfamily protein
MATKAKTKAGRAAQRKSNRSQAPSRKSESGGPNAIQVLKQDHRKVEEWFDEYDDLQHQEGDRRSQLSDKICTALKIHAQLEEEIFYPRASEVTQDDDLIDESLVEHAIVKHLIAEIEAMEVDDDLFDAKIRVLGEMVKHHIQEEEEELFPDVESAGMDLNAVAKELAQRQEELTAAMRAYQESPPVAGASHWGGGQKTHPRRFSRYAAARG